MGKKKAQTALAKSSIATYAELLAAAKHEAMEPWKKLMIPRPWQLWRLVREDPCKLVLCDLKGEHFAKDDDAVPFVFLTIILGIVDFLCIAVAGLLRTSLPAWLIAFAVSTFIVWTAYYPAWFAHRIQLRRDLPTTDPEQLLSSYLLGQFDQIRIEVLGDDSESRVLQKRLEAQLADARRIREQMAARHEKRPEGEHKRELESDIAALQELIEQGGTSKNDLDTHIAKLEAAFAVQRFELEGAASDLPLLEESRALIRAAEASIGQVEVVKARSLAAVQQRVQQLQDDTAKLFGGTDSLFTDRIRMKEDLEAFDRRLAAASKGALPASG